MPGVETYSLNTTMKTRLIALALIVALTVPAIEVDIPAGQAFEVPPDQAEPLLTAGLAKLADAPLAPPAPKARGVKVRLLISCSYGNADDVVTLPSDVAKDLQAQGSADANKEAVAYALTLPQNAA